MTARTNDDGAVPQVRLRTRLIAYLGGLAMRLLGITWRVRRINPEAFDGMLARGEPFIVVFWHGEIFPVTWTHRHLGFAPMISRHADGEIIARIVLGLGYHTVRGSTSRGGVRALLEAVRLVEQGTSVGFTPDGPRGPRHEFAPGALIVAQRTGRPIMALSASADRAWRLSSWDQHLIPKPFARVTIRYAAPAYVQAGNARDVEAEVPRFEAVLNGISGEP